MPEKKPWPQKQPNSYLKYSSIVIQMAAVIAIGCWGGIKLDKIYNTSTPVFTIVLSLISIFAAMYLVLKDFIKPKH